MANMKQKQLQLPLDDRGEIFELFVKDGNREFVRHVRFLRAQSLSDAEDAVVVVLPDYWKTMSVRWVDEKYAWNVYEDLHYALSTCKSVLDIIEF
jgi:hypothetical protein